MRAELGRLEVLADEAMRPPELRPGRGESGILRHATEVEVARHRQLDEVAGDLVGAQVELVGARGGGSLAGRSGRAGPPRRATTT